MNPKILKYILAVLIVILAFSAIIAFINIHPTRQISGEASIVLEGQTN